MEAMEIVSDTTRIRLATFQLEGEAQVWWNWAKTSRDLEAMTWADGVLPLPATRTYEEGLPLETGIPRFPDSAVPVSGRT